MTKAKEPEATPRARRHFTAEFKLEAVRRAEERRTAGVPLTQVARDLRVTDDLLRSWRRQVAAREGAAPPEVFPGHGRLPSDEDEVRRLTRGLARAQQEIAFLESAAAYFARESRAGGPAMQGIWLGATSTPPSRRTGGSSRCGSCARRWA